MQKHFYAATPKKQLSRPPLVGRIHLVVATEIPMPKITKIRLHSEKTVNEREYIFTPKHHHGKRKGPASWLLELTFCEEFSVFAEADRQDYSNEKGKLYGLLKTPETRCRTIGTKLEQVAVFDPPPQGPWHGYPVYPLEGDGEKRRPSRVVLDKMVQTKLITQAEADRLDAGRHI